ncbi:MAG: hypothetical protein KGJ13_12375 [Patescibacteria group bacterium]|nr:hypothetical protein [Patescibacteria group bacterium]
MKIEIEVDESSLTVFSEAGKLAIGNAVFDKIELSGMLYGAKFSCRLSSFFGKCTAKQKTMKYVITQITSGEP